MHVVDGDSTPKFSMGSLQPEHIWTGWSKDAVSPFYLKTDGMHHPCVSKWERWIGPSSWLSTLAFYFGWSCHHPTLSLNPLKLGLLHHPEINARAGTASGFCSTHRIALISTAPSQCWPGGFLRAVPMVEETWVGHLPHRGANIKKKASQDKEAACGSFKA